jgi:lysozyme family protein
MDSRAMKIIEKTLRHEVGHLWATGGYVNHPHDPGGETKWGISRKQYPTLDIANLTLEQAMKIYYLDYYLNSRLNLKEVDLDALAWKIFDIAVNMGPERAAILTQRAFNAVFSGRKLVVDGWLGNTSIYNLNLYGDHSLVISLMKEQLRRYAHLVRMNPNLSSFIVGWTERAFDLGLGLL